MSTSEKSIYEKPIICLPEKDIWTYINRASIRLYNTSKIERLRYFQSFNTVIAKVVIKQNNENICA